MRRPCQCANTDVSASALTEAQDINLYLKPLRGMLEEMEQVEFDELQPTMAPLMRVIALIWANSLYYNTPGRLIVLLQEICNMLITLVTCSSRLGNMVVILVTWSQFGSMVSPW